MDDKAKVLTLECLVFALGCCVLAQQYGASKTDTKVSNIQVSGTAVKEVTPDIANISLSAKVYEKESTEAQNDCNKKVNDITNALKEAGISEENIQISHIRLNPEYSNNYYGTEYKEPELKGYWADADIELSNISIEQVSDIINKSVESGADRVNNLEYRYSKYDEEYKEVLGQAVKQAQEKAESIVKANGTKGKMLMKLTENSGNQDVYRINTMLKADSTNDIEHIDLEPGTISIEANVNAEFEIK